MPVLISKDEPLAASSVVTGYHLLKALRRAPERRLTMGEASKALQKVGVTQSRPLLFGLMFLHSADLVTFDPPYFVCSGSDE